MNTYYLWHVILNDPLTGGEHQQNKPSNNLLRATFKSLVTNINLGRKQNVRSNTINKGLEEIVRPKHNQPWEKIMMPREAANNLTCKYYKSSAI